MELRGRCIEMAKECEMVAEKLRKWIIAIAYGPRKN